jgi:hypothetical protein
MPIKPSGCTLCATSTEPGWLCADHSGLPWGHDDCPAEGAPCVCNPTAEVLWSNLFATNQSATANDILNRPPKKGDD